MPKLTRRVLAISACVFVGFLGRCTGGPKGSLRTSFNELRTTLDGAVPIVAGEFRYKVIAREATRDCEGNGISPPGTVQKSRSYYIYTPPEAPDALFDRTAKYFRDKGYEVRRGAKQVSAQKPDSLLHFSLGETADTLLFGGVTDCLEPGS